MGDLFSKPKLPAPAPVLPMPDPADPAVLAERQRVLAQAAARSGRASTLLSGANGSATEKLGTA